MKTKQVLFIIGLTIFLAFSCKQDKSNSTTELWVLDLVVAMNNEETAVASEFFSDVEMVVLDGKGEWYFPDHIVSGRYYKDYSLFYDTHARGAIGVFSRDGLLVLSLDKRGKGPGEYSGVSEIGMDYS